MMADLGTEIPATGRDDFGESKPEHFIIGVFLVICALVAILGNGAILAMFGKYRHLRTPSNALILILAVIDLGMAVTCFPISAWSSFAARWTLGAEGCNYYGFISMFCGLSIIGILTLMAIDRYVIICCRNAASQLSWRHYNIAMLINFINAGFWAVMPNFGWSRYAIEPSETSCAIDYQNNDALYSSYLVALFIFCFVVPLTTMISCYWRAHSVMTKREEVNNAISDETRAPINVEWVNQREVTQLGAILVLLFLLSWSTEAVVCLWAAFGEPANIPYALTLVGPLAIKASIVLNPLVIAVMIGKFRSHLNVMFRRQPEIKAVHIEASKLRSQSDTSEKEL